MNIQNAIDKAKEIVKQRGEEYGDFGAIANFVIKFHKENLKNINICMRYRYIADVDKYNCIYVALYLMGLKLARLENQPNHEDSVIDFFGYLDLLMRTGVTNLQLVYIKGMSDFNKSLIDEANIMLRRAIDE